MAGEKVKVGKRKITYGMILLIALVAVSSAALVGYMSNSIVVSGSSQLGYELVDDIPAFNAVGGDNITLELSINKITSDTAPVRLQALVNCSAGIESTNLDWTSFTVMVGGEMIAMDTTVEQIDPNSVLITSSPFVVGGGGTVVPIFLDMKPDAIGTYEMTIYLVP